MKIKSLIAVALSTMLLATSLVGCKKDTATTEQKIVFNLGEDPDTIDPTLNTSSGAGSIIHACFEGLMKLDKDSKPVPGLADYTLSEDGLVYTFTIKEDAKWSDGQPVKATDFLYSWTRALTKSTAAEYAYQMFYIKDAEKFYNGEVDFYGVKAIDDKTLEVTLEVPTAYFTELLAFPTYMPLREDIVGKDPDKWTFSPETYVGTGAFKLKEWKDAEAFVFEKNEHYYDADKVKLDTLEFSLVTDQDSAFASLEKGDIDMVNSVPIPMVDHKYVNTLPQLGTYFFAINVGKHDILNPDVAKALSNPLVRKALSISIDRKGIIDQVAKGNQVSAEGFVPVGVEGFGEIDYGLTPEAQVEEAKKLLAEAGYPNGEGLPALEIMYNSEGSHKDIVQVIQQNWQAVGVKTNLANQEWKVFLNTRQNGEYQIARHGWIGDYIDAMTFLDMWVTDGGNNDCGYSNPEYDKLVLAAKTETDTAKRRQMLLDAEKILMEDAPIIPLYYYNTKKAWKPSVKDVVFHITGSIDFTNAYME